MKSDEVNSVTGKKSVIFKEGEKKRRENVELIRREEPVGPKLTLELIRQLNLSDSNLSFVYNKEKEGFLPGHEERMNFSNI